MKTVSKGRLKARMLEFFREIETTGVPLIVTDRGREVLEIRPVRPKTATVSEVLAEYRSGPGRGLIPGEATLLEPLPADDWESLKESNRNPW